MNKENYRELLRTIDEHASTEFTRAEREYIAKRITMAPIHISTEKQTNLIMSILKKLMYGDILGYINLEELNPDKEQKTKQD